MLDRNRIVDNNIQNPNGLQPSLKPQKNAIPVAGRILLDLKNDVGELLFNLNPLATVSKTGDAQEIVDTFLDWVHPDGKDSVRDFLKQVSNETEEATLSPVLLVGRQSGVVGLIAKSFEKGGGNEISVLDLSSYMNESNESKRRELLYAAVLRSVDWLASSPRISAIYSHLLRELLTLSDSEGGFIGIREFDFEGQPFLKTKAMSDLSWNEETRNLYKESAKSGFVFNNLRALFGPTILEGATVVVDDYGNEKRGIGLPEGHPQIRNFLCLPIYLRGNLYGAVGLANCPERYSQDVISSCTSFLSHLSELSDSINPFLQEESNSVYSNHSSLENKRKLIEHLELPLLIMDGLVILGATAECCKLFGCLASSLIDIDLRHTHNHLGIKVVDVQQWEELTGESETRCSMGKPNLTLQIQGHLDHTRYFRVTSSGDLSLSTAEVLFVQEITSRVEAMNKLVHAARVAVESSRLQHNIVNMISHELRTPLTSLVTSVELVELTTSKPGMSPYFETIYSMVDKMTTHIDSVLLLSEASAESSQVTLVPIDYDVLLKRVKSSFEPLLRQRIQIKCDWNSSYNRPILLGDESMFQVIFSNLLSNALKFSTGSVAVVMSSERPSELLFEISDNGIGIPQNEIGSVFGNFYRASNVGNFDGTGIGLSIVNLLTTKMKGKVHLISEVGSGTTVQLSFNT
ncbi:GAF domain-containing sensor histidine kinase [bacterium]|nr:GAF domain-containing sensor histidine kinase [bacterium]